MGEVMKTALAMYPWQTPRETPEPWVARRYVKHSLELSEQGIKKKKRGSRNRLQTHVQDRRESSGQPGPSAQGEDRENPLDFHAVHSVYDPLPDIPAETAASPTTTPPAAPVPGASTTTPEPIHHVPARMPQPIDFLIPLLAGLSKTRCDQTDDMWLY